MARNETDEVDFGKGVSFRTYRKKSFAKYTSSPLLRSFPSRGSLIKSRPGKSGRRINQNIIFSVGNPETVRFVQRQFNERGFFAAIEASTIALAIVVLTVSTR